MLPAILALFPAYTHPLTLVSDPDGLLGGEAITLDLTLRGFRLLQEQDPVLMRRAVEAARPFTAAQPTLILTPGPLEALPYDLWQIGHKIRLSIHQYFPNLAYPVVRALSPDQLDRLSACPQPDDVLGRQKSIEFLLDQVFGAAPMELRQPHRLLAWLTDYHHSRSPMPPVLQEGLIERLARFPEYRDWNLAGLVGSEEGFREFMVGQWSSYLQRQTGKAVGEAREAYLLPFEQNESLQDLLPDLVRKQILTPLPIEAGEDLPRWAHAATVEWNSYSTLGETLLQSLSQDLDALSANPQSAGWTQWKHLAEGWARLNEIWHRAGAVWTDEAREAYRQFAEHMDRDFSAWLTPHYSSLGAQRLPTPKHNFHLPHALDYLRSLHKLGKFALIVMDGLSLLDWQMIGAAWKQRHPDWSLNTDLLLAQIPTITAISRYALISGLRPAEFADLQRRPSEVRAWQAFWSRQGLGEHACYCGPLSLDRMDLPAELGSSRLEAVCLIDNTMDELAHSAVLGTASQVAALQVWLNPASRISSAPLEGLIADLLSRSFTVFLASDHGHVEAKGFGQPSEGLLAQTRGRRARLYEDRRAAERVQSEFPDTILWEKDGLLPEQLYALIPQGRRAFAAPGETVVTHGGLTVEELIVPFVQITQS